MKLRVNEETYCDRIVKAALVIDAGRFNSFATFLHAFFFITCSMGGRY